MKVLHFLFAGIALAAGVGAATSAESPRDFAYGLPIQADGREALYRLELPGAVYRGVLRRDLGDLRVFNAAGEVVPHALYRRAASETQTRPPLALKFFPLYGDAAKAFAGLSLRVQRNAAGSVLRLDEQLGTPGGKQLLGYLVDASQVEEPLRAVELDVRGEDHSAKVDLEASDDLATWRPLATQAPLLSLQYADERIEQRRIEFAPRRVKYLRLTWQTMPAEARLAALRAEPGEVRVEVARQWEAVAGQPAEKAGEYLFDAQGQFPVDRVRFDLPQANTVAPLQLFSRARASDPWRPLTHATAYRLRRDGGEIVSPEIALGENADRYWRLAVDQKGGGLGAGEPRLRLGWRPHEVVWVARGQPPFTLAYGSRDAKPSAYPIESLVPGCRGDLTGEPHGKGRRGPHDALPSSLPTSTVVAQKAAAGSPGSLGGGSVLEEKIDLRRSALWAALFGGVALLGWMAWRLWRQLDGAAKSARPPDSGPAA
jgi:hypothetical protein